MEFNQKIFHPGETLAEKLDEMDLTPKQFSKLCGIDTKTIENIIDGRRDIDDVIAMVLDDYTGISNHVWLTMQKRWNDITKIVSPSVKYTYDTKFVKEREYDYNKRYIEIMSVMMLIQSLMFMILIPLLVWKMFFK